MRVKDYIAKFSLEKTVTLVGPYYQKGELLDPVIFIDVGAKYQSEGLGFSVGDNDSYAGVLQEKIPCDKDLSDLAYVLQQLPQSIESIRLLGFLGGRRDHELATTLEVLAFANNNKFSGEITWEDGVIRCVKGDHEFLHHGVFSVFCFFENTEISLAGNVRYKVSQKIKTFSSHGLSNEASGYFTIASNQPILIYFV